MALRLAVRRDLSQRFRISIAFRSTTTSFSCLLAHHAPSSRTGLPANTAEQQRTEARQTERIRPSVSKLHASQNPLGPWPLGCGWGGSPPSTRRFGRVVTDPWASARNKRHLPLPPCPDRVARGRESPYLQTRFSTQTGRSRGHGMNLLWGLVVVLVVLWLLGFTLHVGGGLIHLLLVIALIVIVVRLVTGRGV